MSATTSASFTSHLEVSTATGTVTYTVTGGTTSDFTVATTGYFFTTGTLAPGTYSVSGTDQDSHGDTGNWSFTLHVSTRISRQVTPGSAFSADVSRFVREFVPGITLQISHVRVGPSDNGVGVSK